MPLRGQIALGTLLSSGVVALVLASVGGYVTLSNDVLRRPTAVEVEHIVDLKTADKLAEINHRLAHIEESLERLGVLAAQRAPHAALDPENWPKPPAPPAVADERPSR